MKIKFKYDKNAEKDYFMFNLPCTISQEANFKKVIF